MKGAAVARDCSEPRTCSGNLDNVVVIDVECDSFPDVVIIDVPEHCQKKSHGLNGSRGHKTFRSEDVISIDDEDGTDVDLPEARVECHTDFDSDATSGKKSCHASSSVQNSGHPAEGEDGVLREKIVSNSSAKVPSRTCSGLNEESESESSDSDSSDCELIDSSSFDTFREKWEKASLKRRNGAHKARSGMVDDASASGSHSDGQSHCSVEKSTKHHQEILVLSGSSNGNFRDGGYKHRLSGSLPRAKMHFEHKKTGDHEEEDSLKRSQCLSESHTNQDGDHILEDKDKELSQGENALMLRKRKEAETLRSLDVERRQKQRVEEVRDTQKKDEEYMSLKEQLKAEIQKKLKILEVTSINMASILRGLGILVGGGFWSTPDEVRAAYKKAVLRFHPDRASRTDIRQQVEAEEKFKLITRMKEKFLS